MRAHVSPCSNLSGVVAAPPSKNYTTRYLLAAALADGESLVVNPAANDDAMAMRRCLIALGAEIEPVGNDLAVRGFGRHPRARADLDVGNAGAVLRFLLAVAALGERTAFHTAFPESLGRRPNDDLLAALETLGCGIESRGGCLPIVVRGGRPAGGTLCVNGAVSSQYLSGLLFLAPLLPEGLTVRVAGGLRSQAAVRTTIEVLGRAGVELAADWEQLLFHVPGGQSYRPGRFVVNGDYPAALSILAAAAILPGEVTVEGLLPDSQGERAAIEALIAMGAPVACGTDRVTLTGGRPLRGISFDGDRVIDAVLSLSTAAAFADGTSIFNRVGHLRYKESDRLGDFAAEMRRAGLEITPAGETLIVRGHPGPLAGGVTVSAHQDHRLIMALTAVGLRAEDGLIIEGAEHVSKSYPGFFEDLKRLGASIVCEDQSSSSRGADGH